jgi:glucose-1-phosphate adenylyltransferase
LFTNVRVEEHSVVEDTVVLPEVTIGKNCRIQRAVIDKRCYLAANTVIGEDPEEDARRFYVSPEGVTLVVPKMLGQETRYVR